MFQPTLFTVILSSDVHSAIQDAHPSVVGVENYVQVDSANCSNE